MAIYISNSIYLAAASASGAVSNRPLIGWNSVFTPAQITPDPISFIAFSGHQNVWSPDTYTATTASNTDPDDEFDCALIFTVAESVNYFAIAGHNLGSIAAEYSWQRIDPDTAAWINMTTTRIVSDDKAIMDYVSEVVPHEAKIRLLVKLQPGTTLRIAHVKIGNILRLERPYWTGAIPGSMDVRVEKIGSKSYAGQHLGSVLVSQGEGYNIEQQHNSVAFIRSAALQNFFKHAYQLIKLSNGPVETFFYAWRPDTHPLEIQYCGKTNEFSPPRNQKSNSTGGLMEWSMSGDAFR